MGRLPDWPEQPAREPTINKAENNVKTMDFMADNGVCATV
jgi:hypothetical protein